MKRKLTILPVMLLIITGLSSFAILIHSSAPPQGYTGADGMYCTSCHTGNSLNTAGGSVSVNGLPDGAYSSGTAYNFSVTISHANADRRRWGFSIAARNSSGQDVGTFSTTNPDAGLNGDELSHSPAVSTVAQSSYTYQNLTWTAPVNPGAADNNITFYYVGNAANGASGNSGDFIYAGTKAISLSLVYTFNGNGNWDNPSNWSNNTVPPSSITGNASIVIDPPVDGECVLNVPQTIGPSVNFTVKEGKKFRIQGNLTINQ